MEEEGIECVDCECPAFQPQRLSPRLCAACPHGWFHHAKGYILTPLDLNTPVPSEDSNSDQVFEEPDGGLVWRLGSLILWGTQAIPVRLKILLDRLLSAPLPAPDRQALLEDFGWTEEDLGRNYILQDHMGRSLSRWEMASPVEELAMLRFFATTLGAVTNEGIRVVGRLAAEMIGTEADAIMSSPPSNLAPSRLRDFITAQNEQMDPFIRHYEVCRARSEDGGGSHGEEEEEEELSEGSNAPPTSSAGIFPSNPFLGAFSFLSPSLRNDGEAENLSLKTDTPRSESPLLSATGKRKVTCDICLHNYCDKGALKIHKGAKHFGEMHACTIPGCPYLFSSRRSRNRHSANPNPKLHKRDPKKDYSLPPHCRVVSPPAAAAAWEREQRERGISQPSPTLSDPQDPPAKRRRKNNPMKISLSFDSANSTLPPASPSPFQEPLAIVVADEEKEEEQPLDFSQGPRRQKSPSPPPPPQQQLFRPGVDVSVFRAQAMQENMLAAMIAARQSIQQQHQQGFHHQEDHHNSVSESNHGDDLSETASGLDADENPIPLSTPAPSPPGGNGGVIMSPTKTALGTIVEVPIYQNNPRRCTGCQKDFQNHFSVKTHYLNVHLKILIPCTIPGCNSAFPSKRSRDRHSQNFNLHQKLLTGGSSPGQGFRPSSPFSHSQPHLEKRREDEDMPEHKPDRKPPQQPKPGEMGPMMGRPMLPFPYQHWLQSLAAANPQLLAAYGSQLGALGALSRLQGGGGGPMPNPLMGQNPLLGPNPFQVQ